LIAVAMGSAINPLGATILTVNPFVIAIPVTGSTMCE
jgi:hypothetical protein